MREDKTDTCEGKTGETEAERRDCAEAGMCVGVLVSWDIRYGEAELSKMHSPKPAHHRPLTILYSIWKVL